MKDGKRWFADIIVAGLDTELFASADLMRYTTGPVMASHLPSEVLGKLLDVGLASGKIDPGSILETATPAILSQHVPLSILWPCFTEAAEKVGFVPAPGSKEKKEATAAQRTFLTRALASGLDTKVVSPANLVVHVNAQVLGEHLPRELLGKLLQVSLGSGKINPDMVLEVFGVEAICAHAPVQTVWECLAESGDELIKLSSGAFAKRDESRDTSEVPALGAARARPPAAAAAAVERPRASKSTQPPTPPGGKNGKDAGPARLPEPPSFEESTVDIDEAAVLDIEESLEELDPVYPMARPDDLPGAAQAMEAAGGDDKKSGLFRRRKR